MDISAPAWWPEHSPATYSAWFAGLALVVTATAAFIALKQLRHALDVRKEQARPSVVAFDEVSPRSDFAIEIVIKNFGTTVAKNVCLRSTPTLRRAANMTPEPTDVPLPEIPTLAPGQEWRTVWDWTTMRLPVDATHGLPDRHDITVTFEDSRGTPLVTKSVFDLAKYRGQRHLGVKTLTDVGKALEKIEKHLGSYREGIGNRVGVRVWTRDGEAKDVREEAAFAALDAEEEEEMRRRFVEPVQQPPNAAPPPP